MARVGVVDHVYVQEHARRLHAYGHQMPASPRRAPSSVPRSAISLLDDQGLRLRHLQQLKLAAGQYRKHMLVEVKTTGGGLGRPLTTERKRTVLPPDPAPPRSARAAARKARPPAPRRGGGPDGAASSRARTVEPQLFGVGLERPQTAPEHMAEPQPSQPLSGRRPGSGRPGALPDRQMMHMMVGVVDLESEARGDALSARARLSQDVRGPRSERFRASAPPSTGRHAPAGGDTTAPAPPVDWMVVEESLQQDLVKLLEQLRAQRDSGEEFDPALLASFRHCFQRLIEKFRAYRPLMSMLKDVYDSYLDGWSGLLLEQRTREKEARARLSEADAVESRTSTENAKEHNELDKQLKTARRRQKNAEAKRLARHKELAAAKSKHFSLRMQINELEEAQEALRAGGRRKTDELDREMKRLDIEFGATWEVRDRRDTILKNKKTAQTGLADCERLLRLRKQELTDSIKELDKWASEKTSLLHELKTTSAETESLGGRTHDVDTKLRNMRRGAGDATPRPDWEEATDILPNKLDFEEASVSLARQMSAQILKLREELETTREQVAASERAAAERGEDAAEQVKDDGGEDTKWFVCKGTGPHVPQFLRANGKVRNRRLPKIKLEEIIEEFWSKKILHDARHDTAVVSVPEYFYKFLQQKVGDSKVIVEWGYNIADSCRRYSRDADVEIFSLCLFGNLPEAAYHGQMKMISEIQEACTQLDRKQHGGRTTETVDRVDFVRMIKETFAYKSDDDMKALQQALSYDQPLPVISYVKLFESDRTGDQGRFAETLRDQYVSDAQSVYPEVEQCMRTVLADFVDSAMPDTKLLMPAQHKQYVKDFRSAPFFKAFDVNEVAVILGGAEVVEYSAGERIIAEGGQARWIFLLVSGMATAHMEMLPSYKKDYSSPGDFFGEQAIVKHHKFKDHAGVPVRRAATIVAGEHGAVCLVIRMNNNIEKQLIEKNSGLFNRSQVRKTRLFAPFDTKNDRFAKTDSGQT
jgi:hypothetical protein